jgi:hypothetical protein
MGGCRLWLAGGTDQQAARGSGMGAKVYCARTIWRQGYTPWYPFISRLSLNELLRYQLKGCRVDKMAAHELAN